MNLAGGALGSALGSALGGAQIGKKIKIGRKKIEIWLPEGVVRLCWYRARLSRLRATAPTSTKGSILRELSLSKGAAPNFLELRYGEVRMAAP